MLTQTHVGWLMTGLLAALGTPLACGGTASQADGAGGSSSLGSCTPAAQQLGGGFEACEEGYLHRPSAGECALPPRGVACDPAVDLDITACSADADCASAPNGRCNSVGGMCLCDYPCTRDEDCGAGMVCLCGDASATVGGRCAVATCRTDADCGGGLCASSTTSCGGGVTFACLTVSDECRSDSDCGAGYMCQANSGARSCVPAGCGAIGRPFLVAGEERLACPAGRADWAGEFVPNASALSEPLRHALALAWTRAGLMEHASIAAFARFTLQLLSLGAPAELVERAQRALADETRHARVCFAFASAHAGEPVGPGALDVSQALNDGRFEHIVCTAILEGCVGETLAAAEAREAAANASDPGVAAALHAIAEDEAEHAALAWRFVAWAIDVADAEARSAIRQELDRVASSAAPAVTEDAPLELARHGFVVGARRRQLRAQVMAEVVAPCAHLVAARARKNIQIVSEIALRV